MRGFTLAELVVVLAILVSVGLALTFTMQMFYRSNAYLLETTASLDSARREIADTVRTIREASYGDDGSFPLSSAATSSLTFFADVNSDGSVEKVRYYLLGTSFFRGVTKSSGYPPSYAGQPEASSTIATYVRNTAATPLFTYLDASGTPLTYPVDVSQVASITITPQIDLNPTRAPNIFTLAETATLRNLRTQ